MTGPATGTAKDASGIAVAITVYRPDPFLLEQLIGRFAGGPHRVYLHIDGPVGEAIAEPDLDRLRRNPVLRVSQAETNQGIAAGLNRLAAAAERDGHAHILYFDQDSEPEADLPGRLLEAFRELGEKGARPAAIGPLPVPHDPARSKGPRYRRRPGASLDAACAPVDYLITSGSLVDLAALKAIGPFTEDYRIDAVDVEWCFRAWSHGFSIWLLEAATMPHRIGSGVVRVGPLAFPRQNAARMQTYIRNQFHMLRLPHVPARWKLRTIAYVPAQALVYAAKQPERRLGTARSLLLAAWKGFHGS